MSFKDSPLLNSPTASRGLNTLFKSVKTESTHKLKDLSIELARAANINLAIIKNSENQTLLHVASGFGRERYVEFLINEGSDVNARDNENRTPLHYACNHAHKSVAKLLIDAGADVNLVDDRGWSPLDWTFARRENSEVIIEKFWDIVRILLDSGSCPYKKSESGVISIERVRNPEQRLWIRLLYLLKRLTECDSRERIVVIEKHIRCKDFFDLVKLGDDHIDIIRRVLTPKLVKCRLETSDNITPLHRAAGYNHLKVAELLLENGADVNALDDHGQIPLHNAARYGHLDMIKLLIDERCRINTQSNDGNSPLHVAASSHSLTACLRLINLGANINLRNLENKLPYDLAETDDIRDLLMVVETPQLTVSQSDFGQAIYIGLSENEKSRRVDQFHNAEYELPDELMLDSKSDERLFSNPNHEIKMIILDKVKDREYRLVEQRMLSTMSKHSCDAGGTFRTYDIVNMGKLLHEKVWKKYKKSCEILDLENVPRNERLLFHGSSSIDKITSNGFDHRYALHDGMFGAGIYFASHSSKSNQYTFGWGQGCLKHADKSCYVCERKMIYAQVALGKSYVSFKPMPELSHSPPGYWSVSGEPGITEGLQFPEYVIYDGHQAYPLYVITYKIKP